MGKAKKIVKIFKLSFCLFFQADSSEAPILVVAPHSTFLDGFVVFWSDLPYIVSREENKKIPFLGKCIEFTQALFVSR